MSAPAAIFDRALLEARRRRARKQGAETFLLDRVAADLGERLSAVLRRFERAADIGTPGDAVRRALVGSGKVAAVEAIAFQDEVLSVPAGTLDLAVSGLASQSRVALPGDTKRSRSVPKRPRSTGARSRRMVEAGLL